MVCQASCGQRAAINAHMSLSDHKSNIVEPTNSSLCHLRCLAGLRYEAHTLSNVAWYTIDLYCRSSDTRVCCWMRSIAIVWLTAAWKARRTHSVIVCPTRCRCHRLIRMPDALAAYRPIPCQNALWPSSHPPSYPPVTFSS